MSVNIEKEQKTFITWEHGKAVICKGKLELDLGLPEPLEAAVANDPHGFAEFAMSIRDELEAHKPEPEKPARKARSDKGMPKKKPDSEEATLTIEAAPFQMGVTKIEPITPLRSEDVLPRLDIHGPNGTGIFRASFRGKMESGFVLTSVVKNLKASFGGKWPEEMSDEDKKKANDLIAGKKPE